MPYIINLDDDSFWYLKMSTYMYGAPTDYTDEMCGLSSYDLFGTEGL